MREGVRNAVIRSGSGLSGASRTTLLTVLCAGAFAPLVAAAVGAGAVVAAGAGVLSGIGGNILSRTIEEAIDRLRRTRGTTQPTTSEVERELAGLIEERLAPSRAEAEELRSEIAVALREIGAAQEAMRAAVAAGDESLQDAVMGALGELAAEFTEFSFMLTEIKEATAQLQQELYRQDAAHRYDRERNRQHATQLRLIRDKLVDIERAIVARTGVTDGGTRTSPWSDQPPYRGLWPYLGEHEEIFHGRARLTAELTGRVEQRLTAASLVVVTGASGAGKSSLLRAGLLPAIGRGQLAVPGSAYWPQLVLTPTSAPLTDLATHLAALANVDAMAVRRALVERPHDAHLLARQAVLAHARTLSAAEAPPDSGRLGPGGGSVRGTVHIDRRGTRRRVGARRVRLRARLDRGWHRGAIRRQPGQQCTAGTGCGGGAGRLH